MKTSISQASAIFENMARLDGGFHASDGMKSLQSLKRRSLHELKLDRLGDVCIPDGIFIGGRSKRIYVQDISRGIPFLSSSDMLMATFETANLVSKTAQADLANLILKKGWVLISRSGTIGNMTYVRDDMEGLAGSEHIMRVVADKKKILSGYVFTFLNSPVGQSLIKLGTFGSVIDTIAPEFVANLPIPRLESAIEEQIHQLIEQAADLRVQANLAKKQAEKQAEKILHLSLQANRSSRFIVVNVQNINDRFEATYHLASSATDVFRSIDYPLTEIGELLERIFYLGKLHRVFVNDPKNGVPLLSISDVQKAKLSSDKYVSKNLSRNVDDAMLEPGWVLVSRVGSPGIVTYTRREMVGMAGTDHLVRLIAKRDQLLPGYLFTVLGSPLGRKMLVGATHGSVQMVLPPEYIQRLKIPVPPIELQRPIHDLIEQYGEALSRASELENQAQAILSQSLQA